MRFALRRLLKSPGFTLTALFTLALGIGANTAIFSLVRAVILRPPPYPEAEQIVFVWNDNRREKIPDDITSWPTFSDWRSQNRTLSRLAGYSARNVNLTGNGEPEQVASCSAGDGLFETLGVSPFLGRWFTADEQVEGKDGVAILSHALWQRRFGSAPAVLGQSIEVNGRPLTVIGVMPPRFAFPERSEIYLPLAPAKELREARSAFWLPVLGRLKPGVTVVQAQADLGSINDRIEKEFPDQAGYGVNVVGMHDWTVRNVRPALQVLFGAVGCVLLIGCANLANLLLARGVSRRREIAIRCALGAKRGQIVRQFLAESLWLSIGGGLLGLLLGWWGLGLLKTLGAGYLPRPDLISTDGTVLAATALVSILCGLGFGLVPAWHISRADPQESLKAGGPSQTSSRSTEWTRSTLVVVQAALSVVLLVGAGLLLRSFWTLAQVPTGLHGEQMLSMPLSLPRSKYDKAPKIAEFLQSMQSRLGSVPGVQAVTGTTSILLSRLHNSGTFTIEGRSWEAQQHRPELPFDTVAPNYFATMNIPLVEGRAFNNFDGADAPAAVIVNETFARTYWPGRSALGQRFLLGEVPPADQKTAWLTIVGVVRDTRRQGADQPVRIESYFPLAQEPANRFTFIMRASLPASAMARPLREAVWSLDKDLPVPRLEPVTAVLDATNAPRRLNLGLIGAFALLALGLAAMGLHGVMAYSVTRRTGEFGIRMALGAQPRDVLCLVLGQGVRLMAVGLGLGVMASLILGRVLESLLFGVHSYDLVTYLGVITVLGLSALLACWLPALHATRVNAIVALRAE